MSPYRSKSSVKRSASAWPTTRRAYLGYGALFGFVILCQITVLQVILSRWKDQSLADGAENVREVLAFSAASLDRIFSQTDALLISLPEILKDQITAETVTPQARRLLAVQSSHDRVIRSLAIVATSGDVLIAEPPGSIANFASNDSAQTEGLEIGSPYRSPRSLEWSIQVRRRLRFSDGQIAYAVAKLSIPALASEIAASTTRAGVSITAYANGYTFLRLPFDDDAIGPAAEAMRARSANDPPEFAALKSRIELRFAPIALEVEMTPDAVLAEWDRDITWIVALSVVIWLLQIAAVAAAIAYAASRARSRADLEAVTRDLAASRRQAQAAADARGMFIANMNHELRTPLNAVIGFSEILASELFGPIGNPRYREYAADIQASGTHLLSLIDDIIDFSTIDMGHRKLKIDTISLRDAIEDALRLTRPQASARDLNIIVSGVAPEDRVEADPLAFRQVLLNLLSNAIKFSPHGERIRICREPDSGEGWVELTITDSGPGVSEADLEKLGEQFFRTKAATANAIGGAGLGLSISISLMQLMHGVLFVHSKLGEGATVIIRIPAGKTAGAIDAPVQGADAGADARAD